MYMNQSINQSINQLMIHLILTALENHTFKANFKWNKSHHISDYKHRLPFFHCLLP